MAYWPRGFAPALATTTRDQLENNIQQAKDRINQINVQLDGINQEQITLQAAITQLDQEIVFLQQLISDTETEISRLQLNIEQLQVEIEAQTIILKRILVLLYQRSGASTFELLMAADSFSDYLNDQEYLDRLREGVHTSVRQIQILQADLQTDQANQVRLLADQKAQEILLQGTKWEKGELLIQTQNQEALFQERLAVARAEQLELEKALEEYLASLLSVKRSLGKVSAGDVIGKNGNTGWSTGPHLHLAIYTPSGVRYDPLTFLYNRNLVWPMASSGGWVSQGFHAGHQAIDIAAEEGIFIYAIDDGDIIHRGCLFADVNAKYATFGVIIDHGDYVSLYIHLQAPDNPQYNTCNINRRSQYGVYSIDYDTKE